MSMTVESLAKQLDRLDALFPGIEWETKALARALLPLIERHIAAGQQGAGGDIPLACPWDDGSPSVNPRPIGMVYPMLPDARAFGYLDGSGIEWAAYDTAQMERYARSAFNDGWNYCRNSALATPQPPKPAGAVPEPKWLTALRSEVFMAPMKSNFTLSRDELKHILAPQPKDAT